VATASLRDLAATVAKEGIKNPAVIVIGDVAQLAPGSPVRPGGLGPAPGPPGPAHPDTGGAATDSATPDTGPGPGGPGPASAVASPPPAPAAFAAGPGPVTGAAGPAHPPGPARRVLVLGGARSGKSQTAEAMLAGFARVDYVATGAPPGRGDQEWDDRVREHRQRRPAQWRTVETLALADVLAEPGDGANGPARPPAPVLVDCLTTWLARVMDECGAWGGDAGAGRAVAARIDGLLGAWSQTPRHVIAVSNEIGSGVVPETASGRRFRDELGRLNARIAAGSDEVWLCTAGIARRLR
jgi:adenosylcobinamide kinase/adenosylcobinamide-phosphate guanylyltransferase